MVENCLNVAPERGAPFLLSEHPKIFHPHSIMARATMWCGLGIEFIIMRPPEYSDRNKGRCTHHGVSACLRAGVTGEGASGGAGVHEQNSDKGISCHSCSPQMLINCGAGVLPGNQRGHGRRNCRNYLSLLQPSHSLFNTSLIALILNI